MVLTLYGNPQSTCTKRVAIVFHEKQVPFNFVAVDFAKGEHKSPEFVAKQPFGQIPYLDDDGYIIYESRAIARYIEEKYAGQGTALIPKDLKAKGHFEQAASVEVFNFDAYASAAVFEKLIKPYQNLTPDIAVFDALIKKLEAKLDVYEQILSKQKYLGGDEVTLADLSHLPYGSLLPAVGSNVIESRPNVAKWFKSLQDRPSWQAVKDVVAATA
ncbi:hypothetical protein EST38_g13105 [Candolleomyces aberdarensis]|uniref:glutathione transferase n=1 Tax=Candolleomyces aberdarensis TaxID=2316362 RepID=A0A4Q2D0Q5_9AGAR|nr:hypothetical protein EST38_g13105 [Candolleomyces aberdarensis]